MPEDEKIRKCVLVGFSDRLAKRLDPGSLRCVLSHGRFGLLSRESVVQNAPFFVAAEISEIEGRDKSVSTLLSLGTAVETSWLEELYPDEIETETFVSYDATARCVLAEEQTLFRGIPLAKKALRGGIIISWGWTEDPKDHPRAKRPGLLQRPQSFWPRRRWKAD